MKLKHTLSRRIHSRPPIFAGFTLIELMISIALVLILILGVNQIFTYTTQAVGAGQAINSAIRDSRAFNSQLGTDMSAMVAPGTGTNNSGALIISSRAAWAFRDKTDQAQDIDGFADTRDLNNDHQEGDKNVPGELIAPYTYNLRNHREDVLSFFARDQFSRQTGNLGTFVDTMASQEVWVWYGHLWLPDNTLSYYFPATFPGWGTPSSLLPSPYPTAASNPNNLYATQMVLGRWATLLREKSLDSTSGNIVDNAGYPQNFINRRNPYPAASGTPATELEPLCATAQATDTLTSWAFQDARYDLAATTISSFRNKLISFIGNTPSAAWWDQMMDGNVNPSPALPSNYSTRFKCNPFVAKPMTSVNMAQATPYMLGGCSQFIVEYAGDYFTQDNNPASATYGLQATAASPIPDGQIDYVLIAPPGVFPPPPRSQWRKQILWYGLPRNTSGIGTISMANGDVAPLATVLTSLGYSVNPYAFNSAAGTFGFEKSLPQFSSAGVVGSMVAGSQYICAWGPSSYPGDKYSNISNKPPSLIRITITLDDPTGRLPEGQTYQYIFPVPAQ